MSISACEAASGAPLLRDAVGGGVEATASTAPPAAGSVPPPGASGAEREAPPAGIGRVPAGTGVIRVARAGARSGVTQAFATSPLRLLLPRNHGRAAWIFTSSFGGGFVGGDAASIALDVGDGAAAFVSTQSATKVYRGAAGSSASMDARVGDEGLLVHVPDPVVPFASSSFRQRQRIDLAAGANLVALDRLTCGRSAAGERWAFREYDARLHVRIDGTPLVHDSLLLRQADGPLPDRLGRFDVLAIVAIAGMSLREHADRVAALAAAEPLRRRANRLVSAAPLAPRRFGRIGCLVRIAGTAVDDVEAFVRELLAFVPALLGDDPWARKW